MKRNTEPYVKTKRKQNTKRNIFIALMLIYPLLHFVVFTVYINFDTIALCFQRFNIMAGKNEFVGLYWFKKFFSEMAQSYSLQRSFINSLLFIPVTNLILLPLSVLAAYFLYKKVPFSRMYRVTFFLPSIVSITIMTMCFSFMFDSTFGVVNDLLSRLGFINPPVWLGDPNTAMPMVFFYCVWVGIGFNVVLLGGAMGRIPDEFDRVRKSGGNRTDNGVVSCGDTHGMANDRHSFGDRNHLCFYDFYAAKAVDRRRSEFQFFYNWALCGVCYRNQSVQLGRNSWCHILDCRHSIGYDDQAFCRQIRKRCRVLTGIEVRSNGLSKYEKRRLLK